MQFRAVTGDTSARDGIVVTMLRVALCQVNLPVGEIDGNANQIRTLLRQARDRGAEVVVFPELSITGYPPEDLLLRPSLAQQAESAIHALAPEVGEMVALVGFPHLSHDLYNAAAVLTGGPRGRRVSQVLSTQLLRL